MTQNIGSTSKNNFKFMITEFKLLEEIKGVSKQVIYLSKSVEDSSKELSALNSNIKQASTSSDKNSLAMKYLTGALVFLGFVQCAITYFNYRSEQKTIDIRKQCYQNVLQTSDIDLNYKSCLRDNGLSN